MESGFDIWNVSHPLNISPFTRNLMDFFAVTFWLFAQVLNSRSFRVIRSLCTSLCLTRSLVIRSLAVVLWYGLFWLKKRRIFSERLYCPFCKETSHDYFCRIPLLGSNTNPCPVLCLAGVVADMSKYLDTVSYAATLKSSRTANRTLIWVLCQQVINLVGEWRIGLKVYCDLGFSVPVTVRQQDQQQELLLMEQSFTQRRFAAMTRQNVCCATRPLSCVDHPTYLWRCRKKTWFAIVTL